ncbi:hypothetical protein BDD12DRAFT_912599 [Trichophaea hybrida]|nr:hypothetical protein BDD12DRAFT_912599 [Trichophaea hybrida]
MSELPQPAEVKIWTFRQLLEWLKRYQPQLMDKEHFGLFEKNMYSGAAFLVCDKDEFVAAGLPRGIAVALDDIVRRIRGADPETLKRKRIEEERMQLRKRYNTNRKTLGAHVAQKARTEIWDDIIAYSDPSLTMYLPFLGPSDHMSSRFIYNSDNEFRFRGREPFKKLAELALSLEPAKGRQFLFLHGTLGVGKSHLMAALACYLTRRGKRVVFLPDCLALLKSPLPGVREALTIAFSDEPLLVDEIFEARTKDDLEDLCAKISTEHTLYFLIDQANALDTMPEGEDRVNQSRKDFVKDLLNTLASKSIKIESSSANYKHGLNYRHREVNETRMTMYHGLQPEEMRLWWEQEGACRNLAAVLKPQDLVEIEEFTGRIPYLLREFEAIDVKFMQEKALALLEELSEEESEQKQTKHPLPTDAHQTSLASATITHASELATTTITATRRDPDKFTSTEEFYETLITLIYEHFWETPTVEKLVGRLAKFVSEAAESMSDRQREGFRDAMVSCIMGKAVPADSEGLLDWRFCFVDKGIGNVSCDLVRRLLGYHVRSLQSAGIDLHPTWEEPLTASAKQPSGLGFQIENMILTYIIARGCKPAGEPFDCTPINRRFFKSNIPDFDLTLGFTIYIPVAAVDAILVNRKKMNKKIVAEVIGVQITISNKHKDTESDFFALARSWRGPLDCDEVTYKFLWILENVPAHQPAYEFVKEKRRANKLVHPNYERIRSTIADVSQIVGRKLVRARQDN